MSIFSVIPRSIPPISSVWSVTEIISSSSTSTSESPDIVLDSSENIHIAWEDATDYNGAGTDYDIFHKSWDSQSDSWSIPTVISKDTTGSSVDVSLAVDSDDILHFVWSDWTDYNEAGTDTDIFYRSWDFQSDSWSVTTVVSTDNTGLSAYPEIAVGDNGFVHITWDDTTDYNGAGTDYDIFYRLFAGPPVAPEFFPIIPSLSETGNISLNWMDVNGAETYYLFRETSYFSSLETLDALIKLTDTHYMDEIENNGTYYYAIVAGNDYGNSSLSNVEYVQVEISDPSSGKNNETENNNHWRKYVKIDII